MRVESGSVARLLRHIPYLLLRGFIPPLAVLNEVLRSGRVDAGMSGAVAWKRFELTEDEFRDVVDELAEGSGDGRTYRHEPAPDWVLTRDDWSVWLSHRTDGIPVEENLRLHRAMKAARDLVKAAERSDDEEERIRRLVELNSLCMEWSDFIAAHRGNGGGPP
jgi:hypothetical protein